MITDRDRDAIAAHVASLDIEEWAPLTSAERDLVRRSLGRATTKTTDVTPTSDAA